jgi:hypothetical protein
MQGRHVLVGLTLLTIGARVLPAQRATPVFGVSVGALSMESATAAREQVGDRSYGLQLDAGMLVKRHLYLGIDLGGQFLDDEAEFTQNTTGGEMQSTASVTYLSAMVGARTGALPVVPLGLGLNVGTSVTMTRRSIDECEDCRVDKLDIPGGAFVEPTLSLGRRRARFRASSRLYLGGEGMRTVLSVGADLHPGRRQ